MTPHSRRLGTGQKLGWAPGWVVGPLRSPFLPPRQPQYPTSTPRTLKEDARHLRPRRTVLYLAPHGRGGPQEGPGDRRGRRGRRGIWGARGRGDRLSVGSLECPQTKRKLQIRPQAESVNEPPAITSAPRTQPPPQARPRSGVILGFPSLRRSPPCQRSKRGYETSNPITWSASCSFGSRTPQIAPGVVTTIGSSARSMSFIHSSARSSLRSSTLFSKSSVKRAAISSCSTLRSLVPWTLRAASFRRRTHPSLSRIQTNPTQRMRGDRGDWRDSPHTPRTSTGRACTHVPLYGRVGSNGPSARQARANGPTW